ncbi:MAG TPA: endonuclease/exonuclease/phosphatase family protein [Acidimicrobiales bacterium]|nr:endonuclease/exonuclease/phosphatase family protein [Acidimicrobiales bacterium]
MRVATYNIQHGAGSEGVLDLERTAATLAALGAELIGLQEVDRHFGERSGFVDQPAVLGAALGMHVVFGANLDRPPRAPGAPRRQYGNAILSAHPVLTWRNVLLPRPAGGEQRGLLDAVVDVDGAPVRVLATHLQHDSQAERLAQVDAIVTELAGMAEPLVMAGDLNARPGTTEVRRLTRVLVDAWRTGGSGRGYTYDAATPHARIDYVLSSDDFVAAWAAVPATRASDHRPVVADLVPGG